ncbi:MAG: DDE-type integrase/transposase/recombinase [Oscillospiraceae bacterium]|nr:DDE-type integrase/transposase/recombinase [Oscillospiraceae bacterium]
MTLDQKQQVALFRYGVIAPLETGTSDPSISNNEFFRRAAQKTYTGPDGKETTVAAGTIEKWHLAYSKGGFNALLPQSRRDEGISRKLTPDLQSDIRFLLAEHPRITAAEIHRILLSRGSICLGELSASTVERFVRTVRKEEPFTTNKDMRRYERPHINEVWYGDTCFGPYLATPDGKKRVYFIALIDDASRFIVGADVFFNDTFENLLTVIRSAVSKFGRPKLFAFDNGSSYRNGQMELLAARIGSAVHYCEPYTPTSKSKIERWFLTMRMQYLASLNMKDFHSLEELRQDFAGYVSRYNQAPHSSLEGKTPQERFFSEPEQIRRLTREQIDTYFLLEVERRVSADCVIVIDKTEYEVHYRYAKQRIRLRYSPDMKTVYVVEPSGGLTPIRLLNKQDNAVVKRDRVRLSDGGDES